MSEPMLKVIVGSGKYTLIQDHEGKLIALRYGEPWRDCVGDNLILALGHEVESLRSELNEARAAIEMLFNPMSGAEDFCNYDTKKVTGYSFQVGSLMHKQLLKVIQKDPTP